MHTTQVKNVIALLSTFIVMTTACSPSVTIVIPTSPASLPTNTMLPASETATQIPATATVAPSATFTALPSFDGMGISVEPLSIVLPSGLASGARGNQIARTEGADHPYWEITPGHTILQLEGYLLQGRFIEPQIYVYPAQGYAEMVPGAFESIHWLNNIIANPAGPIAADQLPAIPFFNATQVFASNIQVLSFQNGSGVRSVTEYAQYPAPANNHELFYHFQGLTSDGAYYIVAILPISNPFLAETSDAGAALPPQGVSYPYFADPNADMQLYYKSVTDMLNATPPEEFTPTIGQLDVLIQSIKITP